MKIRPNDLDVSRPARGKGAYLYNRDDATDAMERDRLMYVGGAAAAAERRARREARHERAAWAAERRAEERAEEEDTECAGSARDMVLEGWLTCFHLDELVDQVASSHPDKRLRAAETTFDVLDELARGGAVYLDEAGRYHRVVLPNGDRYQPSRDTIASAARDILDTLRAADGPRPYDTLTRPGEPCYDIAYGITAEVASRALDHLLASGAVCVVDRGPDSIAIAVAPDRPADSSTATEAPDSADDIPF